MAVNHVHSPASVSAAGERGVLFRPRVRAADVRLPASAGRGGGHRHGEDRKEGGEKRTEGGGGAQEDSGPQGEG